MTADRGAPDAEAMRSARYGWAFNKARQDDETMPEAVGRDLAWLTERTRFPWRTWTTPPSSERRPTHSVSVSMVLRQRQPPLTRKRAVFSGALKCAVELRLLDSHPFDRASPVFGNEPARTDASLDLSARLVGVGVASITLSHVSNVVSRCNQSPTTRRIWTMSSAHVFSEITFTTSPVRGAVTMSPLPR